MLLNKYFLFDNDISQNKTIKTNETSKNIIQWKIYVKKRLKASKKYQMPGLYHQWIEDKQSRLQALGAANNNKLDVVSANKKTKQWNFEETSFHPLLCMAFRRKKRRILDETKFLKFRIDFMTFTNSRNLTRFPLFLE